MFTKDKFGQINNFEATQGYLESQGLLDRAVFEKELADYQQQPNYSAMVAAFHFGLLIQNHIAERGVYSTIAPTREGRRSIVNLHGSNPCMCGAPDWLNTLYWHELDQYVTIDGKNLIGTLLYRAVNNRVYVVIGTSSLSAQEAADMEDANDIFGAAGPYSILIIAPATTVAQAMYSGQQGTIGSLLIHADNRTGIVDYYEPVVLLPEHGIAYKFSAYTQKPVIWYSSDSSVWFPARQNPDAREQAEQFLRDRYPEIRLVDFEHFAILREQRF